jgi:hypothetical protein
MPKPAKGEQVWSDLVELRPRFQRSVHLERDSAETGWLKGYVVTPLGRELVGRILGGLNASSGARAWSLTGPYGSGKSAYALFAASIFAPASPASKGARALLKAADPELEKRFRSRKTQTSKSGLVPVLATGEQRRIEDLLLFALQRAAASYWSTGKKPTVLREIDRACSKTEAGKQVAATDVVKLFEEVAGKISASARPGNGLFVVLDEAGKALEYASHHPDKADVQVLQELAEAANRSGDSPIVFTVILHQAFEQYTSGLTVSRRYEWAKVQGRFEDIAFREAPGQIVRLISAALDGAKVPSKLREQYRPLCEAVAKLVDSDDADATDELAALLLDALPLHPVTALVLGPLFRSRLGQNERSLFAFLGAAEPGGFQEFIATTQPADTDQALFAPDRLYEYVLHAFGGRLYGHDGHHWAQLAEGLRRLPSNATELDAVVLRSIAILGALRNEGGLRPSAETLALATTEGKPRPRTIKKALANLTRASLIVHRKFKGAYQLWEGSDLNLDQLISDSLRDGVHRHVDLSRLTELSPPRPMVARRHLFQTGTLRFFDVVYADDSILDDDKVLTRFSSSADGYIAIIIPTSVEAANDFKTRIERGSAEVVLSALRGRPLVTVVPHNAAQIRDLAREFAALEDVRSNVPEIQSDVVASRELTARLADVERALRSLLSGVLQGQSRSDWYLDGDAIVVSGPRNVSDRLSKICDSVYESCPVIRSELINRANASSAAAAARRNLAEAMLTRESEERLGIEGAPPELAMYRSVLEAHDLHQKMDGTFCIKRPRESHEPRGIDKVWTRIDSIVDESPLSRVPVETIYEQLAAPPFGIKEALLPILLLSYLKSLGAEGALYEADVFAPGLTTPAIERLLRAPKRFEIQRVKLNKTRTNILRALAHKISPNSEVRIDALLPLVAIIVRKVSELPAFSRNTTRVSERAQAVREAILRSREPGRLIFKDLPAACDIATKPTGARHRKGLDASMYATHLGDSLEELQNAHRTLLEEIESQISTAFGLSVSGDKLRHSLSVRSTKLGSLASDQLLRAFVVRATNDDLEYDAWIDSLAALFAGKPAHTWYDYDIDRMRVGLHQVASQFSAAEALALVAGDEDDDEGFDLIRLAVIAPGEAERSHVSATAKADRGLIKSLRARIEAQLSAAAADLGPAERLAALAAVANELIEAQLHEQANESTTEQSDDR